MKQILFFSVCLSVLAGCATNPQIVHDESATEESPAEIVYADRYVPSCTRAVQPVRQVGSCESCDGFSVSAMTRAKNCRK